MISFTEVVQKISKGFTIVELLIVIVVIAILAAITVVTYSGINQRANNSQRLEFAKAHLKAIKLYTIDNGTVPFTGTACLGSGYPDLFGSDNVGDCGRIDTNIGGEYGSRVESTALYDNLGEYMGKAMAPPANPVQVADQSGTRRYSGVMYDRLSGGQTLEGTTPLPAIMWFYLEGDTSCGGTVITEVPASTDWTVVDSHRSNGNSDFSRCIYPITIE